NAHAIVPFGNFEFVLVHVVAALPLAWWLTSIFKFPQRLKSSHIFWLCVTAGLMTLLALLNYQESFALGCAGLRSWQRALVRASVTTALLIPWCLATIANGLTGRPKSSFDSPTPSDAVRLLVSIAAGFFAIIAPQIYINDRINELSQSAESLAENGRD